jgi:polysaccharide export outer membrane protein
MQCKYFPILIVLMAFFSCVDTRKATSFNSLTDSKIEYKVESLEPVLKKNDLLNILVSSINTEASNLYNLYTIVNSPGSAISGTLQQTAGYLVDQDGNLQFPMLGTIRAAGLTKKQLKEIIIKGLIQKNLLYDPIVSVRYLNYKVTVIGEVAKPSVINVPSEKITLLEAVGLAGDLTLYAKRDYILIIRDDQEGNRVIKRINLNDNDLLMSPYYYLKSDDVVYVPPNNAKVAGTSNTRQWLPAVLGGLSFIAIVIDRLTK